MTHFTIKNTARKQNYYKSYLKKIINLSSGSFLLDIYFCTLK